MKKRKAEEEEELVEEEEVEVDEKTLKKEKRKAAIEKRRNARKKDKAARWSGILLMIILMTLGFLLWVSGELKTSQSESEVAPIASPGRVIIR